MHYAVNYRLMTDEVAHDRQLLHEAYQELAALQPDWLACETFQLDQRHSMMFLIAVEQVGWLDQAPQLSTYLQNLADRCEGEPRAGFVDRPSIDVTNAHEIGLWDPVRRRSTLPLARAQAQPVDHRSP